MTVYASGVRNAYDLLWHRNGHLYAPVNGSARGGNTPASPAAGSPSPRRIDGGAYDGPPVPAVEKVGTQDDYLLRVDAGGYYGHPNPSRGEYVMNGGNPTPAADPCEVPEYPAGTRPDRNWRPPTFSFGKNLSPNGAIEYRGDAFPALQGKILVARYSGGKDVIALTPGPDGEVAEAVTGIDGFTQFHEPLDLCEDPRSGLIYVAEHGGRRITLLRPTPGTSRRVIAQSVTHPSKAQPAGRMLAAP